MAKIDQPTETVEAVAECCELAGRHDLAEMVRTFGLPPRHQYQINSDAVVTYYVATRESENSRETAQAIDAMAHVHGHETSYAAWIIKSNSEAIDLGYERFMRLKTLAKEHRLAQIVQKPPNK